MKSLRLIPSAKLFYVAMAAAMLLPCCVGASTITTTDTLTAATDWSGETLQLQPFNPALGTLTEATLTLSGSLNATLSVANVTSMTSTATATAQSTMTVSSSSNSLALNLSPLDLLADAHLYGVPGNTTEPTPVSQTTTSSYVYTDPGILEQFTTLPAIMLSASTSTSVGCLYQPSGATTYASSPSPPIAGLTATLTYTYTTSPVPEPSTLALFCVAVVGMLGCAWRKRE